MSDSANRPPTAESASSVFATTQWTRVRQARGDSPAAQTALSELCAAYYHPVFRFLVREGRTEDAARELTQEFFARLLARRGLDSVAAGRGRFRSFLLGAVKHFLADVRDHERAAKRGGGQAPLSLDTGNETASELPLAEPAMPVPDAWFDREWALTVVNRAVDALAQEWTAAGKQAAFDELKPWLLGAVPTRSQAEAAQALGWSDGAIKVAIHRLRKRFRALVKVEIGQTLEDTAQVRDELRYLLEVLSHT